MLGVLVSFTLGYLRKFTIIFHVAYFSTIGKFESDVSTLEYVFIYMFCNTLHVSCICWMNNVHYENKNITLVSFLLLLFITSILSNIMTLGCK